MNIFSSRTLYNLNEKYNRMKVVIVEDEKSAVRNLAALLQEVAPQIKIISTLDSISDTIEWFSAHLMPDLLFLDIHLADGSAFEIFEHVNITCPIIFTTAYDEYALKAFKVNSVDYLLKPINKADIEKALHKFEKLCMNNSSTTNVLNNFTLKELIHSVRKRESYKTHFLIPLKGDKLFPLAIHSISFFYIKDCQVKAVLHDGTEYPIPLTLDELTVSIEPERFFRANRQYLVSREAIKDIDLWFNSRLSINLKNFSDSNKILVSKTKVAEFKEWFVSDMHSK